MSKEQINFPNLNPNTETVSNSNENQEAKYLLLAREKLDSIKELAENARYDLPKERLLGTDPASDLYICRGTVIMNFILLVGMFSRYMALAGYNEKDRLNSLDKSVRVITAISIGRGIEAKTEEDMRTIKQHLNEIFEQAKIIYSTFSESQISK